jgi:Holliday junction DNA helicase RuvA
MIAQLSGILIYKTHKNVIIDVNGVGYQVYVPLSTFYKLPDINNGVKLNIYTYIKDSSISLYGFFTMDEKNIFELLIAISGIGPKLAINILSGISPDELKEAIYFNNSDKLRAIPGLGKKGAERILLELREKMRKLPLPTDNLDNKRKDIFSALLNLGYDRKSARMALDKIDPDIREKDIPLEELLKMTLRELSK